MDNIAGSVALPLAPILASGPTARQARLSPAVPSARPRPAPQLMRGVESTPAARVLED